MNLEIFNKLFFFLIFLSIHATAETFHYYEFKQTLSTELTGDNYCWYCPKDIQTKPFTELVDPNLSYAEKKYGKKVKHKSHAEIIAESKKPNAHIQLGMNMYTTIYEAKLYEKAALATQYNEIDSVYRKTENKDWVIDMMTLLPVKYFGFSEEAKDIYISTKLGRRIDITLYKDLANGRDGDFYFLVGPGMRINLSGEVGEKTQAILSAKTGLYISDKMGIWIEAGYSDPILNQTDSVSFKEKFYRVEPIEIAVYLGFRF